MPSVLISRARMSKSIDDKTGEEEAIMAREKERPGAAELLQRRAEAAGVPLSPLQLEALRRQRARDDQHRAPPQVGARWRAEGLERRAEAIGMELSSFQLESLRRQRNRDAAQLGGTFPFVGRRPGGVAEVRPSAPAEL